MTHEQVKEQWDAIVFERAEGADFLNWLLDTPDALYLLGYLHVTTHVHAGVPPVISATTHYVMGRSDAVADAELAVRDMNPAP